MQLESLEALQDREYKLLDNDYDSAHGLSNHTPVDKYMRINYDRMGEDSEEATMREKRTSKVLQERPIPSYQPF